MKDATDAATQSKIKMGNPSGTGFPIIQEIQLTLCLRTQITKYVVT